MSLRFGSLALVFSLAFSLAALAAQVAHLEGEMAGEVTTDSAILQSRLTATQIDAQGDVPGAEGVAKFEIADNADFQETKTTPWIQADPKNDYIVKSRITGLKPDTKYFYRLVFGPDEEKVQRGQVCMFKTLPGPDKAVRTSFVVVTGMNYDLFHFGPEGGKAKKKKPYEGPDKNLGYPALVAIKDLRPDFFVGTGDNVYYDSRKDRLANTEPTMRKKWHEQFVQPRYVDLWAVVPSYWEKDDHDDRYNDCDNTGNRPPSTELGKRIFKEQVPVTDPNDPAALTYRTYRPSKLVQFWLLEGRDYRSPNNSPDGPEKTIWGKTQRDWLRRTLLESDAPIKVVISPTALVGPDDASKKDNHCDIGGFRHEGNAFFAWAKENGFLGKGLYLVCGDRHWQYHSIHPSGFEEFSCGALVKENGRLGVNPGDKKGTDPEAKIKQPYTSPEPMGGFLNIVVEPEGKGAVAEFKFCDDHGKVMYRVVKKAE